jgi:hypothetical protein
MKPDQKKRDPNHPRDPADNQADGQPGVHEPQTTPAQERGERIDTGKSIARGGQDDGPVPGADPGAASGSEPASRH